MGFELTPRRFLALLAVPAFGSALAAVGVWAWHHAPVEPTRFVSSIRRTTFASTPAAPTVSAEPSPSRLTLLPITPEERKRGAHECNPPNRIGIGPYSLGHLRRGKIIIPQKGGHTDDFGYDVVIHFHGAKAARRYLVQVAQGVVFAGIDYGVGSGRYAAPYSNRTAFPALLTSIEKALRKHTGQPNAYIRHTALTAWSAGYGAINEILKWNGDERVDAVVLLDGLHAGTKPGIVFDGKQSELDANTLRPVFDFARRAARGERLFVLTHGQTGPTTYSSVKQTATLLLSELGLDRQPSPPEEGPYAQVSSVDVEGLHVWEFSGAREDAHCVHLGFLARAVSEILEPSWNTPRMDRNVPSNPEPDPRGIPR